MEPPPPVFSNTLMIPGECGYGAILFGQRLVNNGCVGGSAGSLKCKCDGWRVGCVRARMESGFLCTREAVTPGWDRLCVSNGDGPSSPKKTTGGEKCASALKNKGSTEERHVREKRKKVKLWKKGGPKKKKKRIGQRLIRLALT